MAGPHTHISYFFFQVFSPCRNLLGIYFGSISQPSTSTGSLATVQKIPWTVIWVFFAMQFKATSKAAGSYNRPRNGVYVIDSVEAKETDSHDKGKGFYVQIHLTNEDDNKQQTTIGFSNREKEISPFSSLMNLHRIYHMIQHASGSEFAAKFMESLKFSDDTKIVSHETEDDGSLKVNEDGDFIPNQDFDNEETPWNCMLEHVGSKIKAAAPFVRFSSSKAKPESDKEREGANSLAEMLEDVLVSKSVYLTINYGEIKAVRSSTRNNTKSKRRNKARF